MRVLKDGVLVALAGTLLLSACGSSRSASILGSVSPRHDYIWQAASRLTSGCARRNDPASNTNGFLWLRGGAKPLVYLLEDQLQKPDVVSSTGRHFDVWGQFWPCRTPVAIYVRGRPVMTVLAGDPVRRRTITLGRFGNASWIVAPDGRFVFYHGQTIRPAGGKEFTLRGLPRDWVISSLAPSPRDPSVFLASANTNPHLPGGCRDNDERGGIYLVTPKASTLLKAYDACQGWPYAEWSPDGRKMLWLFGNDKAHLFLSDGRGRHLRRALTHTVCGALWSPDSSEIAWGYSCNRAHVLDLATGRSRFVGEGHLIAWSPDGKELAVGRIHRPWYGPGSPAQQIVAVPVGGGPTHLLIRIPRTK